MGPPLGPLSLGPPLLGAANNSTRGPAAAAALAHRSSAARAPPLSLAPLRTVYSEFPRTPRAQQLPLPTPSARHAGASRPRGPPAPGTQGPSEKRSAAGSRCPGSRRGAGGSDLRSGSSRRQGSVAGRGSEIAVVDLLGAHGGGQHTRGSSARGGRCDQPEVQRWVKTNVAISANIGGGGGASARDNKTRLLVFSIARFIVR